MVHGRLGKGRLRSHQVDTPPLGQVLDWMPTRQVGSVLCLPGRNVTAGIKRACIDCISYLLRKYKINERFTPGGKDALRQRQTLRIQRRVCIITFCGCSIASTYVILRVALRNNLLKDSERPSVKISVFQRLVFTLRKQHDDFWSYPRRIPE